MAKTKTVLRGTGSAPIQSCYAADKQLFVSQLMEGEKFSSDDDSTDNEKEPGEIEQTETGEIDEEEKARAEIIVEQASNKEIAVVAGGSDGASLNNVIGKKHDRDQAEAEVVEASARARPKRTGTTYANNSRASSRSGQKQTIAEGYEVVIEADADTFDSDLFSEWVSNNCADEFHPKVDELTGEEIDEALTEAVINSIKEGVAKCQEKIDEEIVPSEEMKAFLNKHNLAGAHTKMDYLKHDEIWKVRLYLGEDGEENHFDIWEGPRKKNKIVKHATMEYVRWSLGDEFVEYCLKVANEAERRLKGRSLPPSLLVPLGASNSNEASPLCFHRFDPVSKQPMKKLPFRQGAQRYCLGFSVANALHHLKMFAAAQSLFSRASKWVDMDAMGAFRQLAETLQNVRGGIQNASLKISKALDGVEGVKESMEMLQQHDFVVFVPQCRDGTQHAVTYCDGLIFDSTQDYAMYLNKASLDFIAGGDEGFEGIWRARVFKLSKKCKK